MPTNQSFVRTPRRRALLAFAGARWFRMATFTRLAAYQPARWLGRLPATKNRPRRNRTKGNLYFQAGRTAIPDHPGHGRGGWLEAAVSTRGRRARAVSIWCRK